MRGEIYRLKSGRTQGHEQSGPRYAVVVQADTLLHLSTWIVAPTSTSARDASFRPQIEIDGQKTCVLVEQARAVDPQARLGDSVGHLTFAEMRAVDQALRDVLDL